MFCAMREGTYENPRSQNCRRLQPTCVVSQDEDCTSRCHRSRKIFRSRSPKDKSSIKIEMRASLGSVKCDPRLLRGSQCYSSGGTLLCRGVTAKDFLCGVGRENILAEPDSYRLDNTVRNRQRISNLPLSSVILSFAIRAVLWTLNRWSPNISIQKGVSLLKATLGNNS
jgi:hypothetical protein